MSRPKVFVSRRIPDEGLKAISAACDVDLWPDQLPPPYDELTRRVKDCDGLVSLLTDRIDGTLLDSAPKLKVVSNYAVGFNNVDVAAATARSYRPALSVEEAIRIMDRDSGKCFDPDLYALFRSLIAPGMPIAA